MTPTWQANWRAPRPFVHPLRTPGGALLSVDAPDDHPWHHGLWSTIKYVNGENFWEEYDEFGLLHTVQVEPLDGAPEQSCRAQLEWRRPVPDDADTTGEVVLDEQRTLRHVELDDRAYAIDWTVELTPRVDVVLDRTPYTTWGGYGGLTLRGAPEWTDTTLALADTPGSVEQLRGERARWCHLQGSTPLPDGPPATAGVAVLDHPDNPRHPSPWYASTRADTYGGGWANFLNAAFLWHEPMSVARGDTLRLRHLVVVHDDERGAAALDELWRSWTS